MTSKVKSCFGTAQDLWVHEYIVNRAVDIFEKQYSEITTSVAVFVVLNYFWDLLTDSKRFDLNPCFAFTVSD